MPMVLAVAVGRVVVAAELDQVVLEVAGEVVSVVATVPKCDKQGHPSEMAKIKSRGSRKVVSQSKESQANIGRVALMAKVQVAMDQNMEMAATNTKRWVVLSQRARITRRRA